LSSTAQSSTTTNIVSKSFSRFRHNYKTTENIEFYKEKKIFKKTEKRENHRGHRD
jgi:hypothetical protein